MRKLLTSPANKMSLSDAESALYQKALTFIADLSLNLMAVKVTDHPDDFLGWCKTLLLVCQEGINRDLLENEQVKPLDKLEQLLQSGVGVSQLKMLRIAPWEIYTDFITEQAENHALDERLSLLNYINELKNTSLAEMSEIDRLAYAGKHTNNHLHNFYNFDVEWFASTKGAKVFHILLTEKAADFDKALSYIPLVGEVTPEHYRQFIQAYRSIFTDYKVNKVNGEKAPLIPATRLLAMRRPDQFIALTNTKLEVICQGLGLVKFNAFDLESYWQELIMTLRTCAWWHHDAPESGISLDIWNARAILIDLFLYAGKDLAYNSNYLRLRDKAHNKPRTSTRRASSKLTLEEQVDLALAAEDIPEYLASKRDSIIAAAKKGKTVDEVIKLMRSIFG